jgi:predicted transcriptional regulator
MSHKSIAITVGTLEDLSKEFISVWHEAEKGKISKTDPVEKIFFKDETLFFKTLTPSRFNLLKKLHDLGKSSIRALSKELNRDYKNVFEDVKALNQIDLILKDDEGRYYVPWESIITEISMESKSNSTDRNPKNLHHKKRAVG